jgi:hypothetical protein
MEGQVGDIVGPRIGELFKYVLSPKLTPIPLVQDWRTNNETPTVGKMISPSMNRAPGSRLPGRCSHERATRRSLHTCLEQSFMRGRATFTIAAWRIPLGAPIRFSYAPGKRISRASADSNIIRFISISDATRSARVALQFDLECASYPGGTTPIAPLGGAKALGAKKTAALRIEKERMGVYSTKLESPNRSRWKLDEVSRLLEGQDLMQMSQVFLARRKPS